MQLSQHACTTVEKMKKKMVKPVDRMHNLLSRDQVRNNKQASDAVYILIHTYQVPHARPFRIVEQSMLAAFHSFLCHLLLKPSYLSTQYDV
jgi:hypothetical protein